MLVTEKIAKFPINSIKEEERTEWMLNVETHHQPMELWLSTRGTLCNLNSYIKIELEIP